jgi:hypothetical protein
LEYISTEEASNALARGILSVGHLMAPSAVGLYSTHCQDGRRMLNWNNSRSLIGLLSLHLSEETKEMFEKPGRIPHSGKSHRAALVITDFSGKLVASIIRMERISAIQTLAMISN